MIKDGKTYNKVIRNGVTYGKAFFNGVQVFGANTPATDADADAFISATNLTNITHQSAIRYLVSELKTQNLWNKFIAIYPFVGDAAFSHKFNLKDPKDFESSKRLVFNGVNHSSNKLFLI